MTISDNRGSRIRQNSGCLGNGDTRNLAISATSRRGIAMLEVLLAITLLSFLMTFIAATLWAAARVQRADSALFNNLLRHNTLADRFRDDVAAAVAAPAELGILRANPSCLILRLTDGKHIIYAVGEKHLDRIELNEAHEPIAITTLYECGAEKQIDFFPTDDGRLLTLRLTDLEPRFKHQHHVDIMAALAGDVQ